MNSKRTCRIVFQALVIVGFIILLGFVVIMRAKIMDERRETSYGFIKSEPILMPEGETMEIVPEEVVSRYDGDGFPIVYEGTIMKLEVSLDECKTRLFFRTGNEWEQMYESDCIVGASSSPTPIGEYRVTNLDPGGFQKGGNYYRYTLVWYVPNGDYVHAYCFHTVAEDANGNARDDVTTGHLSAGCVRLPHEVCKWMCEHVPVGTEVVIY